MLRAIGLILTESDMAQIKEDIHLNRANVHEGAFELGPFFVIAARKFRDQHTVEIQAKKAFLKISKRNQISGKYLINSTFLSLS